ncbi:uncharacterized protein BKCO1_7200045 [Diplodia corticola]|uniref:Uncharacterized protein n=1 Tax=Diplodia corticola TaxID=236234 RepID=A0A1J9RQE7_9PEZI|nr:uncharacterized protein BKCO1_7200045 [Diplodia corticola]OJD29773.1 hypothetical protein BKCO1_7200045 [Diplodia corticola]
MVRNISKSEQVHQPRRGHQQDFRASSQNEYFPYMSGYYVPQYGYSYYYCPQHRHFATEGNDHRPRVHTVQNDGCSGKGHYGSHSITPPSSPAATTPQGKSRHSHLTEDEQQEYSSLTDKLTCLANRIYLREEVVLPCLKSEASKLGDMLDMGSNSEKNALVVAILCLGGAVEVMEDELDFDIEQLHDLTNPSEAREGRSHGAEKYSVLEMLQEELFPAFDYQTYATHKTGKSSKKAPKIDPRPKSKTPKTRNTHSHKEI